MAAESKAERAISGAVAFGPRVYRAGDEAELYAALGGKAPAAHLTDGDAPALVGPWGPGDANADGKNDARQEAGRKAAETAAGKPAAKK